MQVILTIAGFDPSGGAGVLADIKTFAAFGCFGAAAITSLTAQNTVEVLGAYHQPEYVVRAQLEPVLQDYEIAAVKIGMLPTAEIIRAVTKILARYDLQNVVVDPVIRSSSGFALLDDEAVAALQNELLPRATVVTPNLAEMEILGGAKLYDVEDMQTAAAQLAQTLAAHENAPKNSVPAILVKGGHLREQATDVLWADGQATIFRAEKIAATSTHGTGCTLSSALAALLGQGVPLIPAVTQAKAYLTATILHAPNLGHGAGPLQHFVQTL